jgi:MFS transporter, DHA2 family, multidrug resistance protein
MAQYLQLVLGLSPLAAGLWTVPSMASYVIGSMMVPMITRRFRPEYVLSTGLGLAAVGFALLTQVDAASGLPVLVVGSVIYSLGISPVVILATDLIVGSAPVERAGAASAISETSAELGGALGIAILGSIGTAIYRSVMAELPDIPAGANEAAKATLGGALAVAGQLPDPIGTELLSQAREAFVQAFELIAAVCAAIVVLTAILAFKALRRPGPVPADLALDRKVTGATTG